MPAAPCPDENALGRLADPQLGEDERQAIEGHLDGCAACSALVGALAGLAPVLPALPARYVVGRRLGAGAMGVVWEAEDRQLGRKVALKWVVAEEAGGEPRARLYREARALAQLRHPNVLTVHEVGEAGDDVFLVLELVDGTTARGWRAAAARTAEEIVAVWRQVGAGLAAVHRAGIVHRDVKPDNVLVASDGRVLLGDFGLATAHTGDAAMALTATGQVVGTPLYMAPEQLRGEPASARSDQFALCVCLWEALTGARPFVGATQAALAVAMLRPPALPAQGDRQRLAVLARGLAAEPAARWPDVDALLEALRMPRARRRGWVTGAVVAAAGAVVVGALAWGIAGHVAWRPAARALDAGGPPDTARASVPVVDAAPDAASVDAAPVDAPPVDAPIDAAPVGAALDAARVEASSPRPPARLTAALAWHDHEARVTRLLTARDGRGCLAELERMRADRASAQHDVALYRAMCTMLAGDCAGGRAALASLVSSTDYVDTMDARWCPLDAPPEARWTARAMAQLEAAVLERASCAPVLAFIEAHHLVLPPAAEVTRVGCRVVAGDCAGARAAWRTWIVGKLGEPPERAEAEADRQFARAYPRCAP